VAIYVLRSGSSSKVGISDSLRKRLAAYNTHNPDFEVVQIFDCPRELARKVELAVKRALQAQRAGPSREWFSVPASVIVSMVVELLSGDTATDALSTGRLVVPHSGSHRIPMSRKAAKLFETLTKSRNGRDGYETTSELQTKAMRLFAEAFALGTPECDLPESVIARVPAAINRVHCAPDAAYDEGFAEIRFPRQDHVRHFYELHPTANGASIAVCRAVVSMPYGQGGSGSDELFQQSAAYAEQIGWTVSSHPEWSWHYPGKTGLILFQSKQSKSDFAELWAGSFKRWVLENAGRLRTQFAYGPMSLDYALEDVVWDTQLPLELRNFGVDYIEYLERRFPETMSAQSDGQRSAILHLFNLWRTEQGLAAESDPVPEMREIEELDNMGYDWMRMDELHEAK
jgi:Meiotically up-regulated gene 113